MKITASVFAHRIQRLTITRRNYSAGAGELGMRSKNQEQEHKSILRDYTGGMNRECVICGVQDREASCALLDRLLVTSVRCDNRFDCISHYDTDNR